MYLKNPDETYIRLDPTLDSTNTSPPISDAYFNEMGDHVTPIHPQEDKIYATNQPDTLFSSLQPEQSGNSPPVTLPDKMIEQLSDGLVQLTLHHDTSKLGTDHVTPWRTYGSFVRWLPEPSLPPYYTASIDMPSRPIQEHLISVFFNECYYILPVLSRSMFYDQLNVKGPLITPLLLNSIYAHASKHVNNPAFRSDPQLPATQGDLFYNRARRLVDDFMDVPRISTVVALLYMSLYENDHLSANGTYMRSSRSWMYSGMAIRMCLELGLHTSNYSSQMSQCDIELRKRVLWTCFIVDKMESCTMERPWMLKSKDISLEYPTPLPEDSVQERLALDGFNQLCRLMKLMEKVIHMFTYEIKKSTLWTIEQENRILHYLDGISQWREGLPNELQWTTPAHDQVLNQYIPAVPSSAIVANLHLVCYDLELSLIMCCRYQDEHLHRDRRRTLANTITHIVSLTVQHPRLMYTFTISTFSGIFAALTHAVDFDNPHMDVSEGAKIQFRKSLEDVRQNVKKVRKRDLRDFARLVDLALHPHLSVQNGYASAFSAISDLCHKENGPDRGMTPSPIRLFNSHDILDGYHSESPERNGMGQFSFHTNPSSPSGSVSAAVQAAATAIGAVGPPVANSGSTVKPIEPGDYTFELISVADEWARSLIY
ncbi:fungal-specific transcription factor domain-containing protein [Pilobolus umbonatus]|nr:fungal-specific transcription factor domain-containing protein [Pilobolus umbonatus]